MSKRTLAALFALHVLAGTLFLWNVGPGFPLDDAWCHLVYARGVAHGDVFAYNDGELEAGVSSPLWTLAAAVPVAVAEHLLGGARPDLGVRILGGLMGFLATLAAIRLAARAGKWPAAFAGLALTLDPLLLAGRYSGMEAPLFSLLAFLLIGALLDDHADRAGWFAGLIVLTRPEGALLAVIALGVLVSRKQRVVGFAVRAAACVVPFIAYNRVVAGFPLPNTWVNKADLSLHLEGIGRALSALFLDTGLGWALPLVLLFGTISLDGGYRRLGRLPASFGLALLVGVVLTRPLHVLDDPLFMPFYWKRYALFAWPMLLFVASTGFASLVRTAYAGCFCRPLAASVLILPLVIVLVFARQAPSHFFEVRERFAAECQTVEDLHVATGMWLDQNLPRGAEVATHDAGAIRYFSRRRVIDVWGNNFTALTRALAGRAPRASPMTDGVSEDVLRANAARAVLSREHPAALAVFPALFAAGRSPELAEILAHLDGAAQQALLLQVDDMTDFFGLTHRAKTFTVRNPATVDSPLHASLAVFVAP